MRDKTLVFEFESVKIWQDSVDMFSNSLNHLDETNWKYLFGDEGTVIEINGKSNEAVPLFKVARANTISDDGKFHLIYIQINVKTGEYYIGKVNREKWKAVKNYQGSGVRFVSKYKKHGEDFVRYYLSICKSAKESERIEAELVNEELLDDPFCLNLVKGGGGIAGTSTEEKKRKRREYMKAHPERYQQMLDRAKELYQTGDSLALRERSDKIRQTMSDESYKEQSRDRILRWKKENPEAYAESRKNNKAALQTESYKQKQKESHERWRAENPEEYERIKNKRVKAMHSDSARKKKSEALKQWNRNNPDEVKRRSQASVEKTRKPVNMLSLETGEVLKSFSSQQEAALWLVKTGYAKNTNCKSSISSVCLKKPCSTGHGYRKKAYGFGWEFADE